MLDNGFLGTDPPRLDADLQRARLAGILRHHANRAFAMGMLSEERLATAERQFARIEDGGNPEIAKQGYVVNLDGERDFPSEYRGVAIEVLTSAKLRKAGVATVMPSRPDQSTIDSAILGVAEATATAPEPAVEPTPDTPPESSPVPDQEQDSVVDPVPTESLISTRMYRCHHLHRPYQRNPKNRGRRTRTALARCGSCLGGMLIQRR
jgi:hypothetical protein